jgi:hypothetical protein
MVNAYGISFVSSCSSRNIFSHDVLPNFVEKTKQKYVIQACYKRTLLYYCQF